MPDIGPNLKDQIGALLAKSLSDQNARKRATERKMEEIDRRLRHIAYLVADLDLRFVIPKLTELASMFPHGAAPRKEGLCDRIWVDFSPTPAYPSQARVSVAMSPDSAAENLRVTVSVMILPVYLPYEREAWLDLPVVNPDTKMLEEFLDKRIVQFVQDYLRVRDPHSPYHEDTQVTDPVCQMTFPAVEAATSIKYKERTFYFCVEGCRQKFEAAPERYIERPMAIKDLPTHERSPLLEATPGQVPPERSRRRDAQRRGG